MNGIDDGALLDRARRGDEDAFSQVGDSSKPTAEGRVIPASI